MSDAARVWRRGERLPSGETALVLRAEDWLRAAPAERLVLPGGCILRSAVCDLGSVEALDFGVIHELAALTTEMGAIEIHEELGFRTLEDRSWFCALPLPRSEETVGRVASRLRLVRRLLPVPVRLQWLAPPELLRGAMPERDFLEALRVSADCDVVGAPEGSCR